MTRVRFDRIFIYSFLVLFALSLLHTHAFASEGSYKLTSKEVSEQISSQLARLGAGEKVQAMLTGYPSSIMASADMPLKVEISSLDYDAQRRTWGAHMRVTALSEQVYSEDIKGRFNPLVAVPVLSRRLSSGDVITDLDITHIYVPENRLRGDTITDEAQLIGKSPRRVIASERPIRSHEISKPIVVEKGKLMRVHFNRGGLHIHTIAEAREDGAIGDIIRAQNVRSNSVIQVRVLANGDGEVAGLNQYSQNRY